MNLYNEVVYHPRLTSTGWYFNRYWTHGRHGSNVIVRNFPIGSPFFTTLEYREDELLTEAQLPEFIQGKDLHPAHRLC